MLREEVGVTHTSLCPCTDRRRDGGCLSDSRSRDVQQIPRPRDDSHVGHLVQDPQPTDTTFFMQIPSVVFERCACLNIHPAPDPDPDHRSKERW